MDIQALVKKAQAEPKKFIEYDLMIADELVKVRVYKRTGLEYIQITGENPPRRGNRTDNRLGFDLHGVALHLTKVAGVLVDGDLEQTLEPEQWDEIFGVLDGNDIEGIATKIWTQYIIDPQSQKLNLLKKVQVSSPAKKRKSRSS